METPKDIKDILKEIVYKKVRPIRDKYIMTRDDKGYRKQEHIVVWEKYNGKRPIGSVIHHINGIKEDNRIENLMLFPNATAHMNYHKKLRRERNNSGEEQKQL